MRSGFIQIQREGHSTDRMWAIAEGKGGGLKVQCGSLLWVGNFIGSVGGLFQLVWRLGGDFQEFGHHPLFGLSAVSWNCHGAPGCVVSLADQGLRFSRS